MRLLVLIATIVFTVGIHSVPAAGQSGSGAEQAQPAKPAQQPDMKAMMEEARKAAMPGLEHAQLAKLAGEYTTVAAFRSPGMPPSESKGTARLSMALEGRFLHEENSGSIMGMAFTGARLLGYNKDTKKYEAVWTYTGSTGMLLLTGSSSDGGKTINLSGVLVEGGGKETLNVIIKQIDNNRFVVELRGEGEAGQPGAVLETTYTRK